MQTSRPVFGMQLVTSNRTRLYTASFESVSEWTLGEDRLSSVSNYFNCHEPPISALCVAGSIQMDAGRYDDKVFE